MAVQKNKRSNTTQKRKKNNIFYKKYINFSKKFKIKTNQKQKYCFCHDDINKLCFFCNKCYRRKLQYR